MARARPQIFVGSSSEAREDAKAFCSALSNVAVPTPWWNAAEFQSMHSVLDGLVVGCASYDFGLFVLTPDDTFESQGRKGASARDNVLLELGLFLGSLGPRRTFAVVRSTEPAAQDIKIPSDLEGIVLPRFSGADATSLSSAIERVAATLRTIIRRESHRQERLKLFGSWGYDMFARTFSVTVPSAALTRYRIALDGKSLAVVARKDNPLIHLENDESVAIGESRKASIVGGDLILTATGGEGFVTPHVGDSITGYILLVPDGVDTRTKRTVEELLDDGCVVMGERAVEHSA